MVRELHPGEVEEILREEIVGRLGCTGERGIYIVPIVYAYDGTFIFGYSADGMKVEYMRKDPAVCFQVDRVEDAANWRSVIAWGTYEELGDREADDAVERLSLRLRTLANRNNVESMRSYVLRSGQPGIAYRIRLSEKTGRIAVAAI